MRSLFALSFCAISSMAIANNAPLLMTDVEVKAHTERIQSLTGEAREAYRNNAYAQLKQRAVELGYVLPERPPWASATPQEEILKMEAMITIQRAVIEEAKAELAAKAAAAKEKAAPSESAKPVVTQSEAKEEKPADIATEKAVNTESSTTTSSICMAAICAPGVPTATTRANATLDTSTTTDSTVSTTALTATAAASLTSVLSSQHLPSIDECAERNHEFALAHMA